MSESQILDIQKLCDQIFTLYEELGYIRTIYGMGKSHMIYTLTSGELRFLWVGDKQYICHRHSSFKPSDKYKYQMV